MLVHAPFHYEQYGKDIEIFEHVVILRPEVISLGNNVRIDAYCKLEGGVKLVLGDGVHIASFSHLNVGGGTLIFGAHSGCSSGVRIGGGMTDLLHEVVTPQEGNPGIKDSVTTIGEYVTIFMGAIINPGVTVGDWSVVYSGSVVTKDIPPGEMWAGVPARKVGERENLSSLII